MNIHDRFNQLDCKKSFSIAVAIYLAVAHLIKSYLSVIGFFFENDKEYLQLASKYQSIVVVKQILPIGDSLFFIGRFLGVSILTSFADRIGRRKSSIISLTISVLACSLLAYNTNPTYYLIIRLAQGIGVCSMASTAWVLATDITISSKRVTMALLKCLGTALGIPILCVLAWWDLNWRYWLYVPIGCSCFFLLLFVSLDKGVDSLMWLNAIILNSSQKHTENRDIIIYPFDSCLIIVISVVEPLFPRFVIKSLRKLQTYCFPQSKNSYEFIPEKYLEIPEKPSSHSLSTEKNTLYSSVKFADGCCKYIDAINISPSISREYFLSPKRGNTEYRKKNIISYSKPIRSLSLYPRKSLFTTKISTKDNERCESLSCPNITNKEVYLQINCDLKNSLVSKDLQQYIQRKPRRLLNLSNPLHELKHSKHNKSNSNSQSLFCKKKSKLKMKQKRYADIKKRYNSSAYSKKNNKSLDDSISIYQHNNLTRYNSEYTKINQKYKKFRKTCNSSSVILLKSSNILKNSDIIINKTRLTFSRARTNTNNRTCHYIKRIAQESSEDKKDVKESSLSDVIDVIDKTIFPTFADSNSDIKSSSRESYNKIPYITRDISMKIKPINFVNLEDQNLYSKLDETHNYKKLHYTTPEVSNDMSKEDNDTQLVTCCDHEDIPYENLEREFIPSGNRSSMFPEYRFSNNIYKTRQSINFCTPMKNNITFDDIADNSQVLSFSISSSEIELETNANLLDNGVINSLYDYSDIGNSTAKHSNVNCIKNMNIDTRISEKVELSQLALKISKYLEMYKTTVKYIIKINSIYPIKKYELIDLEMEYIYKDIRAQYPLAYLEDENGDPLTGSDLQNSESLDPNMKNPNTIDKTHMYSIDCLHAPYKAKMIRYTDIMRCNIRSKGGIPELLEPEILEFLIQLGILFFLQEYQDYAITFSASTSSKEHLGLTILVSLAQLPGFGLLTILLNNQSFKRITFFRYTTIFCCLVTVVRYFALKSKLDSFNNLQSTCLIISKLLSGCTVNLLYLLSAELSPNSHRGLFTAIFNCFSCASMVLARMIAELTSEMLVISIIFVSFYSSIYIIRVPDKKSNEGLDSLYDLSLLLATFRRQYRL